MFLSFLLQASIMSEIALRDNNVPESQRMNGSFSNGNFIKPQVEGMDENAEDRQRKAMTPLVGAPTKTDETENPGALLANSEVEYIESEDLKDVEDVEDSLKVRMFSMHLHRLFQRFIPIHEVDVSF